MGAVTCQQADYRKRNQLNTRGINNDKEHHFEGYSIGLVIEGLELFHRLNPQGRGGIAEVRLQGFNIPGLRCGVLVSENEAVLAAGERVTGVTVHLVDEVYDHGRILAQREVPVEPEV